MRRAEKEITDPKEIEAVLKKSEVCRLAMVDGDAPYIVPLNFGYKDGAVYFHSANEGKKIELMKKNPNVCFEVDFFLKFKKAPLACDWGIEYSSVIAWGKAEILDDLKDKKQGLNIIMAQYSGRKFDFPDENINRTAVIKVSIEKMTGKKA